MTQAPPSPHPVAFTENARTVLGRRYLLRDAAGEVTETPEQLLWRVARHVAGAEAPTERERWARHFYAEMAALRFLPNSPTLMNAGTGRGTLAACFVLPVADTLESIMETAHAAALVQKYGGGTGFDFSALRAAGEPIASTHGRACGPISALLHYDDVSRLVTQGGKRDGANMGTLASDHPDIERFIHLKDDQSVAPRFNISVAVTDEWMASATGTSATGTGATGTGPSGAAASGDVTLRDPRDGSPRGVVHAPGLLREIAQAAWRGGDPGLVFLDRINRDHPTPELGPLRATNPCGEVPLLPYEACTLGSLAVSRFWDPDTADLDWEALGESVETAVRFLDNVVEVGAHPLPEITEAVRRTRKIGLGVMGFADLLIAAGVPYDSEEATERAEALAAFIRARADAASARLGEERGPFPAWERSIYGPTGAHPQAGTPYRNATRTCIAPTGTIAILAGVSSGIEPLFSLAHRRRMGDGTLLAEVHPAFERAAREGGFDAPELWEHLAAGGALAERPDVPAAARRLFVTALDIDWRWHVRMQAAFQRHTDLAVSKTVNLPHDATVDDVLAVYTEAHRLGCKGITVYRDGSRAVQVLSHDHAPPQTPPAQTPPAQTAPRNDGSAPTGGPAASATGPMATPVAETGAETCADCGEPRMHAEGCLICPTCGDARCG